ncbi:DUF3592 domain-containing protein [Streptomyces sp. RPT161]|uniref:DUF3592 domain-containing protein n=1 Tax=Streptomyces sp. RPT161 TaxID=3015993 RepID=UPI0022B92AE8|nr:hypothetical protein [Streptomyces sp. RPT161]
MINGGKEAAQRVLRLNRQTINVGTAYLAVVTVALAAEVLLGLRYLIVSFIAAGMLMLMVGGYLVVRNNLAASELAENSGVAARAGAWFSLTFLFALIAIGGLAGAGGQVRDILVMRSRTVAVIDSCDGSGKGATCSYHWTIDGRTHSTYDNRITDRPTGDRVRVWYTPSDPSYVLPTPGGVVPVWIPSGTALFAGSVGLFTHGRRERRTRREYVAEVSALTA